MATDNTLTSQAPTAEENRMTAARTRASGLRLGACLAFALAGCTGSITGAPAGGSGASAGTTGGTTANPGAGGSSATGGSAAATATGGNAAATASGGTGNTSTGGSGGGNAGTASATAGTGVGTSDCASAAPAAVPFRVMTRLNRVEYDNTVRDLLGDTTHAVLDALNPDSGDGGFDNNAAALTISPALASQYEALALKLATSAMAAGSPGRTSVLGTCNPQSSGEATCASQAASQFAARAWRRPLQAGEADSLVAIYKQARDAGLSFDDGMKFMVDAVLLSPYFLFRPELDATPDSTVEHAVDGYELASRLSYFVWSSMPDAALIDAAANGKLATSAGVQAELDRMWADPKADALFARFPGLWLDTQNVTISKAPAADIFPQFDAALQTAMQTETSMFMRDFMTTDVNFMDFMTAKFSYLNAKLAQFYGISGQFNDTFQRVALDGNNQRGGILTQASFLTVTSLSERTSPVRRGQWVLARVLADPPPPPPAMVPPLDSTMVPAGATMRERLEAHVGNGACASCHDVMDPIGFGLENYDAIGAWRDTDNGSPVDASGTLDTGSSFTGGVALEALLRQDPRMPVAVVRYLLSYALGREPQDEDACVIADLAQAFNGADNGRMSALVRRVVATDAMLSRRGAP
jgi:hypothetical protein